MSRRMRRAAAARSRRLSWPEWEATHVDPALVARHGPIAESCAWAKSNGRFVVLAYLTPTAWGLVVHLAIRSADREPTWAEMQRIKNELVGLHRTAVQVYPRGADLVDQADMYHLWVLPEHVAMPFGLHEGAAAWGCA